MLTPMPHHARTNARDDVGDRNGVTGIDLVLSGSQRHAKVSHDLPKGSERAICAIAKG